MPACGALGCTQECIPARPAARQVALRHYSRRPLLVEAASSSAIRGWKVGLSIRGRLAAADARDYGWLGGG